MELEEARQENQEDEVKGVSDQDALLFVVVLVLLLLILVLRRRIITC